MKLAVGGLCVALIASLGLLNGHTASVAQTEPTTTIAPPVTTTTVQRPVAPPPPLVLPSVMAQWRKVNICEEGGNWRVRGSLYSGGLGITNRNWAHFGGYQFAQNAADATPEQQVVVARRIEASAGYPNYVPDQYGCGHGW